jgi:hypothetical protein
MEIWKTIKSAPNYEISSNGSVRNTKTGTMLKIATNNHGYHLVCLSYKNKRQTAYIHRLIAEAFVATELDMRTSVVNHIDGNKSNNTIENLEWATHAENTYHGRARVKVKAKEIIDILELFERMELEQIDKVLSYAKRIAVNNVLCRD